MTIPGPFDPYVHALDGKVLLVLGGTGFFGKALVRDLVATIDAHALDTRVVVTTRDAVRARTSAAAFVHPSVTLLEADFLHQSSLGPVGHADYVLHMATTSARDTFAGAAQTSKFELLLNATKAVCAQLSRAPPRRVVFTSSGVVYGANIPTDGFHEHDPAAVDHLDPASSLAMGKIASEYLLAASCAAEGVPLSIARCFGFVGPGLPTDIHYAIGNFVQDAVLGRDIVVRGDGQDVRSYMNIRDVMAWLAHLLFEDDAPKVMNVGSAETVTIGDLARRVAELVNPEISVRVLGQAPPQDNFCRRGYWPNISLARARGLVPSVDLAASIIELSAAIRKPSLEKS